VAPRSEAIEKYEMVETARIMVAMLWKKRVPLGLCNMHVVTHLRYEDKVKN
jgi:hypothetical protein